MGSIPHNGKMRGLISKHFFGPNSLESKFTWNWWRKKAELSDWSKSKLPLRFTGNFFYFALHALCWWHAHSSLFVWREKGIRECRRAVEPLFIMKHAKGNFQGFHYKARYLCTEYYVTPTPKFFDICLTDWVFLNFFLSSWFFVISIHFLQNAYKIPL